MIEIKSRLKSIRKQKHYTQGYLAEKLGISLRAYSKIESGETHMTIERLNEIIAVLGINKEEILGCDYDKTPLRVIEKEDLRSNGDSISLIRHYEETISILKEHIETLKLLIEKKQ